MATSKEQLAAAIVEEANEDANEWYFLLDATNGPHRIGPYFGELDFDDEFGHYDVRNPDDDDALVVAVPYDKVLAIETGDALVDVCPICYAPQE